MSETHDVDAMALWRLFDRALVRRDRHHRQLSRAQGGGKIFADVDAMGFGKSVISLKYWRRGRPPNEAACLGEKSWNGLVGKHR